MGLVRGKGLVREMGLVNHHLQPKAPSRWSPRSQSGREDGREVGSSASRWVCRQGEGLSNFDAPRPNTWCTGRSIRFSYMVFYIWGICEDYGVQDWGTGH